MTSVNNNAGKDMPDNTFRFNRGSRLPVTIINGVDVSYNSGELKVKGPKGESVINIKDSVTVSLDSDANTITIEPCTVNDLAIAGTIVALFKNMMKGVSEGHQKTLEIVGVGYRAKLEGSNILDLSLGFSHPVKEKIPAGINVTVESPTKIVISGVEKQVVGQFAADIRSIRPPEPYKGKGIKYSDEYIIRKETKKK
jgi:large subunit ribosomal protein L6